MYINEETAKKKNCPQLSATHPDGLDLKCQASRCMHWRWGGKVPYAVRKRIVPDGVPTLADLEEKARSMDEDAFMEHIECMENKYKENEPPRPENCPASWEYEVDFEEWFEGYFIAWWEPADEADQRKKDSRKGYCGLSGKPYQLEPENA